MTWGFSKIADQIRVIESFEERLRTMITRALRFIGLAKATPTGVLFILLSMVFGIIFNFLTLYGFAVIEGGSIHVRTPPSDVYLIIQYLIAAPLFEELVFRGLYLSSFLRILGKNHLSAMLGLTLSSFTFGWIHPNGSIPLLIKTSGGFLLGTIYMIKWRKNFMAALSAHFGLNILGIFLYVAG